MTSAHVVAASHDGHVGGDRVLRQSHGGKVRVGFVLGQLDVGGHVATLPKICQGPYGDTNDGRVHDHTDAGW